MVVRARDTQTKNVYYVELECHRPSSKQKKKKIVT